MKDLDKWALVLAVPVLSFVVGVVALPRPRAVADERASVDPEALGSAVSTTAPKPVFPVDAVLEDAVRVLGADLPKTPLSRGATLEATFYFGVEQELDRDWQIFVHVDAKQGSGRIHGDHFPVDGKYATTLWKKGEFIADRWRRVIPRDTATGSYDVWVGLYSGEERLEFTDGDRSRTDGKDRIRVGTIEVE